jgi:uncharacterized membrane protein
MSTQLKPQKSLNQVIQIFLLGFILLAILLRLVTTSHNIYFDRDEVRKLLRTSGVKVEQFLQETYDSEIVSSQQFLNKYQWVCRQCNSSQNLWIALQENREHPPLYYVSLNQFLRAFGSILNPKIFSVFISIITLPVIYWLTLELFQDRLASLISTTLMAWSPFQFAMSQHVSQYSLAVFLSAISTAILCHALRYKGYRTLFFLAYTVTTLCGIYTHLFYIFLPLSHLVYLLAIRAWKPLLLASISILVSIGGFMPWVLGIISAKQDFKASTRLEMEVLQTQQDFLQQLRRSSTFIVQTLFRKSSNISLMNDDFVGNLGVGLLSLLLLALLTYFLMRQTCQFRTNWLIVIAIYTTTLPIILASSLLGHGFADRVRYYLPTTIFILIGIAFLISKLLSSRNSQIFGAGGLAFLLFLTIFSTAYSASKVISHEVEGAQIGPGYQQAAIAINASSHALVVSNEEYVKVLMFVHRLSPETDLLLTSKNNEELVGLLRSYPSLASYQDIFVFNPSRKLIDLLNGSQVEVETVPQRWNTPVIYHLKSIPAILLQKLLQK